MLTSLKVTRSIVNHGGACIRDKYKETHPWLPHYKGNEKLKITIAITLSIHADITLPTKVHLVKAMAFPVVMYGCESWTIKKAEHQRMDAFELWCWGRLFRVP